jgi:putative transposase
MIYEFIRGHPEYTVAKWATFYQVSRSGYYAHKERWETRKNEQESLKAEIKRIFDQSGSTYGPDRICGILRKGGRKASYGKVSEYMAGMGLQSIHNRHKTRSLTDSSKARGAAAAYPNLVRDQIFDMPGKAVCSDITYLRSGEGWVYLCVVKDIVSGEILGESSSARMTKELVIQAFINAQARHKLAEGTIFHSDRGSQYTSKEFKDTLKLYGLRQSYSRVGMPGDNAWAESFFATLKKECIHFRQFGTRAALGEAVFAWIEGFYNSGRVQARLGYMSPREYTRLLIPAKSGKAA